MTRLGVMVRRVLTCDTHFRFGIVRFVARVILPQYRFKWPEMAWWLDQPFNDYLKQFGEAGGMNTDRKWTVHQLLRLIESVPGDTAECGVYRGATSYLMCAANSRSAVHRRQHHCFDSFEGMSRPAGIDGTHWKEGDLSCDLDMVKKNLSGFADVSFHKGWIPERFQDVADRRFAFVHIDVDLLEPTRDSVAFFYERMSPGGIIVCDDYGFTTCPGATRAIDEFLSDKAEKMIALSCGGGFMIKGCSTGAADTL